MVLQLEDTPVTQKGHREGGGRNSLGAGVVVQRHPNQGLSDPQVSKVLGGTASSRVIGAQCWTSWEPWSPRQPHPKATHLQEQRPD